MILDVIPFLDSFILLLPWAIYKAFTGDYVFAIALVVLTIVLFLVRRMIELELLAIKLAFPLLQHLSPCLSALKYSDFSEF